jgi:hypothetical protein
MRRLIHSIAFNQLWLLSIFCILSLATLGQTNVGGEISSNTTWDTTGNPYIVSVDILVDQGITLTINPGVVVKFDTGRSMLIRGTLRAIGDSIHRITFTSNAANPKPGDWAYIQFDNEATTYDSVAQSGCVISYSNIEYAGRFTSTYSNRVIGFLNIYPLLEHIIIKYCIGTLVEMDENKKSGYFLFRHNTIENDSVPYAMFYLPGINKIGASYIDFSFDSIENCVGQSISIFIETSKVRFYNNYVANNIFSTMQVAATIGEFSQNKFLRNTSSSSSGYPLLEVSLSAQLKAFDNLFCKNTFSGGDYGALAYFGGNSSSLVSNNIFAENLIDGIYYSGGNSTIIQVGTNFEKNSIVYNTILHNPAVIPSFTNNFTNNTLATNNFIPLSNISILLGTDQYFNFHNNNFLKNQNSGPADLYFFESSFLPTDPDFDATNNWWGTSDSLAIDSGIYDYFDNPNTGVIDFSPFLKQPDTAAPVSPPGDFIKSDLGNGSVQFNWSSNPESDIAGYRIYWDTLNCYSFANHADVGNVNSYTLSGNYNTVYAITAYDKNSNGSGLNDQFNGHESWFTYDQTFSPITGIAKTPSVAQSGISIYPNPFNSHFYIYSKTQSLSNATLVVYNELGQTVFSKVSLSDKLFSINENNLPGGVYYYKLSQQNKTIAKGVLEKE